VCMCVYKHMSLRVCVCVYLCVYVCMCVYVCLCWYTNRANVYDRDLEKENASLPHGPQQEGQEG
jgi:hypothetical protein